VTWIPAEHVRHVSPLVSGTRKAQVQPKSAEIQQRRRAERQGLVLERSRRRDPHALDFGRYVLRDKQSGAVAFGGPDHERPFEYGPELDDIARWLDAPWHERRSTPAAMVA
jgi:hypothetical protein